MSFFIYNNNNNDDYFRRLWCQLELATFARYGGAQKMQFLPLWLAPWLLSTIVANALVATCWSFLTLRIPQEALGSIQSFCTWMLPRHPLRSSQTQFGRSSVCWQERLWACWRRFHGPSLAKPSCKVTRLCWSRWLASIAGRRNAR